MVNLTTPVGVVDLAPPVGVVNLALPVGEVDLTSPVGAVNLAPPVGVVDLAPPVGVVNLTPPNGVMSSWRFSQMNDISTRYVDTQRVDVALARTTTERWARDLFVTFVFCSLQ